MDTLINSAGDNKFRGRKLFHYEVSRGPSNFKWNKTGYRIIWENICNAFLQFLVYTIQEDFIIEILYIEITIIFLKNIFFLSFLNANTIVFELQK